MAFDIDANVKAALEKIEQGIHDHIYSIPGECVRIPNNQLQIGTENAEGLVPVEERTPVDIPRTE